MQKNVTDVLFSTYHQRILSLLLLHPDKSYYVREIARLARVPPGSLHRELKNLAECGLLLRHRVGNQVRYRPNIDCPIFPDLANIFRKTTGMADVLGEALAPLASKIDSAFVFGSVAQGKERVSSDVDVFVVGSVSFVEVVKAMSQTHTRLDREINPVVMPSGEFQKKLAESDRFVTRIVAEPKIFFIGTADDFGKLAENRAAEKP